MCEKNIFVLLTRGLIYSSALLLFAIWGGVDEADRALQLIPLIIFILILFEITKRWHRISKFGVELAVITDFFLISLLTFWLTPKFVFLFVLALVGDGIRAGWKIVAMLGIGACIVDLINNFPSINSQNKFRIGCHILFWLVLNLCVANLAKRKQQGMEKRAQLEKALQIRSDRLSMLSHEIRTPLTLMHTSLELLFDGSVGKITDQQRIFLETIYQNEERIGTLAQNLLTQAKLEAGVFSPKTKPVDLRHIIRLVVNDLRILIEQRNQQIRTYYPQVLPIIPADPALIRQVMINLIQNASRYTSEGGCIIVSVARNDHNLLVSVTDDGAGMGNEYRRQLFRRFSTSEGGFGEGTGLGLVIVKQIIERHGGQVYVDTLLGRGTSFYLTLPYNNAEV